MIILQSKYSFHVANSVHDSLRVEAFTSASRAEYRRNTVGIEKHAVGIPWHYGAGIPTSTQEAKTPVPQAAKLCCGRLACIVKGMANLKSTALTGTASAAQQVATKSQFTSNER
jgi:hypothetical protein